jgi:hypothetical protein
MYAGGSSGGGSGGGSGGVASPRMTLTARGRGRQESLLNVLEARQSRQPGSLSSGGSMLNLPVWDDADVKEGDDDDDHEEEEEAEKVAEEDAASKEPQRYSGRQTTAASAPPARRFNRDLTTGGGVGSRGGHAEKPSEYLSASTSAAVAAMINNTRRTSQRANVHRSTQAEDDRVLAWLAAQAEPSTMTATASMRYAENAGDLSSQWHVNPRLREPARVPRSASQQATLRTSVEKRLSELGMSLADNAASPGSVEESVLQLMFESLLDNLTYPRHGEDEAEYQSLLARAGEDDRASLAALRRGHRTEARAASYSIPDLKSRPGAESAAEACYLHLVRRVCLEKPGHTHDLAKTSGISVELASRVQKELIGVVTDMFTDPSIVSTIKTATLSRVFKGTPIPQGQTTRRGRGGKGFFSP